MGETDYYKAFDPWRICDVCGFRRRFSQMSKHPGGVWVCNIHKNERTKIELDRLNAKIKPFRIIPVANAKPGSIYPDVMEAEEAVIMNFVARMTAAGSRYESVVSGMPTAVSGELIAGLSWAARYLYAVITDTTSPSRVVVQAKAQLLSIAAQLMARQQGFDPTQGDTRANLATYGGLMEDGTTTLVTEDTATSGLAFLYAYRVFGTSDYIVRARAAANYLRNVQAIGSNGITPTTSDATGTARLYTGGLASEALLDSRFPSNGLFYPSSLVALQFWNELLTTDGDQSIGTTGVPDGFVSACDQMLSVSIAELRSFWLNGVQDSAGDTLTGLSSVYPREFFNAYPAVKDGFPSLTGTGRWEYENGPAATGTTVSSLNFAKALSALYAYEGASSQVTAIDDWMRSFESFQDFETPAETSAYTLARSVTGTYDATLCPASLLLVRDADADYEAIRLNGSGLYDWGAFGLLSPMWATRHTGTFANARQSVFGRNLRYSDGSISDGDYVDWKSLRGLSGLSYQTAFTPLQNDVARSSMFGLALHQRPIQSQVVAA